VRLVSEQALVDDPLRLLRAARIATQLGFAVEASTLVALRQHAGLVERAAAERQRDELMRCFATDRAAAALRLLDETGLLERVLPEVTAGRGVEQPTEHYWDVLTHNVETVAALDMMLSEERPARERDGALHEALWTSLASESSMRAYLRFGLSEGRPRAALLKLAGLLHDVAKPETRAPDESGRIRFLGHAERGAETARAIARRLRLSRSECDFIGLLVEEHLRPTQLSNEGLPTRRALYRFFRDTGDAAEAVLLLSLADALAARGPRMEIDRWRGHAGYIAHVLARRNEEESIARPQRLLAGEDIMSALGIGPGPAVGRLLRAVEEAQGAGEVSTREEALTLARRLAGERRALLPRTTRERQGAAVAGAAG
jgi:poly(A) polymerase